MDETLLAGPDTGDTIDRAIERAKADGKFIPKDVYDVLEKRKQKGLWDGEIDHIIPKTIVNLTSGPHYYVLDPRTRHVTCTSCSVKHGGILEAHLLTRYKVEDGVLYLDGKAINKTP